MIDRIVPAWPYSERLKVITTLRSGGVSRTPFESLNLADHVGDDAAAVAENRARLGAVLPGLPVHWLSQVHGVEVVRADGSLEGRTPVADALWTSDRRRALAILTADCLPVVIADKTFQSVVVVHAGWRGLVNGILRHASAVLRPGPRVAWIGPGIGPSHYEVGQEVLQAVLDLGSFTTAAIVPGRQPVCQPERDYLDLFKLAELLLDAVGVVEVYCERRCTAESADLYSYRRDGLTGRFATVAWLP